MLCLVTQSCPTLFDPGDCSPPGSSVHGDSPDKSGLPCPPPRDLPNPGIHPRSPALQADSLLSEPPKESRPCYFAEDYALINEGSIGSMVIISCSMDTHTHTHTRVRSEGEVTHLNLEVMLSSPKAAHPHV